MGCLWNNRTWYEKFHDSQMRVDWWNYPGEWVNKNKATGEKNPLYKSMIFKQARGLDFFNYFIIIVIVGEHK